MNGYTIIELAGIGPAPMGGMMLADMGAQVIRIDRVDTDPAASERVSGRGKQSVALNLKTPAGIENLLRMIEQAEALIDPFRPLLCEKLGLGPDTCLARNPRLVFARMTGWGQSGPLAQTAGHDINYIARTALGSLCGCCIIFTLWGSGTPTSVAVICLTQVRILTAVTPVPMENLYRSVPLSRGYPSKTRALWPEYSGSAGKALQLQNSSAESARTVVAATDRDEVGRWQ